MFLKIIPLAQEMKDKEVNMENAIQIG